MNINNLILILQFLTKRYRLFSLSEMFFHILLLSSIYKILKGLGWVT
jgi:hypothetical protein